MGGCTIREGTVLAFSCLNCLGKKTLVNDLQINYTNIEYLINLSKKILTDSQFFSTCYMALRSNTLVIYSY